MELIPILSTIILVATISTFILSIGAYILYKLRERKTVTDAKSGPAAVQAELVVPADVIPTRGVSSALNSQDYQSPFTVQKPVYKAATDKPSVAKPEPKRFSVEEPASISEKWKHHSGKSTETKFFKYTSEGYVPTEDDKAVGSLKWR